MENKKPATTKRFFVTLPIELIERLEQDSIDRGLNISRSVQIQLAIEKALNCKEGETK